MPITTNTTAALTGELVTHLTSWVEPIEDDHYAQWLFRVNGREDRTVAYTVTVLPLPSGELPYPFYVVTVLDGDRKHGWPLTNLDYTIRDQIVLVSDAIYTERLVDMWRQLALRALQALVMKEEE